MGSTFKHGFNLDGFRLRRTHRQDIACNFFPVHQQLFHAPLFAFRIFHLDDIGVAAETARDGETLPLAGITGSTRKPS